MTQQKVTTRQVIESDLPAVLGLVQTLAAHHGDTSTVTLDELAPTYRGLCGV